MKKSRFTEEQMVAMLREADRICRAGIRFRASAASPECCVDLVPGRREFPRAGDS